MQGSDGVDADHGVACGDGGLGGGEGLDGVLVTEDGEGLSAGGEGIERDLLVLEDVTVSLITERRVSQQPWGLAGDGPGAGENWLLPGGDVSKADRLPDKCTIRLGAGDVLGMLTPGGGGWGEVA